MKTGSVRKTRLCQPAIPSVSTTNRFACKSTLTYSIRCSTAPRFSLNLRSPSFASDVFPRCNVVAPLRASSWVVGDGLVETNKMGPLAHSLRLNAMEELLSDAKKHGAHFDAGGSRIPGPRYFSAPPVLSRG